MNILILPEHYSDITPNKNGATYNKVSTVQKLTYLKTNYWVVRQERKIINCRAAAIRK